VSIFYRFRDIDGYLSKVADFDPPHLHSAPPVEFRGVLWLQKLSCGVVCVILRLAVLVELRLVTDGQTDGHRHRHRSMAVVPRMRSIAPYKPYTESLRKSNFVHFSLKIWHLLASNLLISLRSNWPQCVISTTKFGGLATIWRACAQHPLGACLEPLLVSASGRAIW